MVIVVVKRSLQSTCKSGPTRNVSMHPLFIQRRILMDLKNKVGIIIVNTKKNVKMINMSNGYQLFALSTVSRELKLAINVGSDFYLFCKRLDSRFIKTEMVVAKFFSDA
jgi:hypothetical protein